MQPLVETDLIMSDCVGDYFHTRVCSTAVILFNVTNVISHVPIASFIHVQHKPEAVGSGNSDKAKGHSKTSTKSKPKKYR